MVGSFANSRDSSCETNVYSRQPYDYGLLKLVSPPLAGKVRLPATWIVIETNSL